MMDRMLCLNFLVPKCYLVSFWLLCLAWIISLLVDFSSFSYYVFTLVDFSSFSYYVFTLWCLWAFQTLLCLSVGPVPLWPHCLAMGHLLASFIFSFLAVFGLCSGSFNPLFYYLGNK
jgi:hypothetical protein